MISQYNVVYAIEILKRSIDFDDFVGMRVVSYLPMAHIAERAVSHYQSMMLGYSVYCCPDPNQLTMYLKEVHPQLAFGVPRVWEKIYNGVNAALAADPERKAQFDDGVNAAIEIRRSNLDGDFTEEQQATLDFLDSVAFSNVRALVGLDAVELAITGAAPIPVPVLEWFNAIGVRLAEIYGMSETTGPMTFSPERPKIGTVGRPTRRLRPSSMDGSTRVTSARSTTRGTSRSSTARRNSSSPRAARTSARPTSKRPSRRSH